LTDPGILLKDTLPSDIVKTDGTVSSAGKQILHFFFNQSVFQIIFFKGLTSYFFSFVCHTRNDSHENTSIATNFLPKCVNKIGRKCL